MVLSYCHSYTREIPDLVYWGDPRPCILPQVMASSAVGAQIRVFRFLPTMHPQTNTKLMYPRYLHGVRRFTHVLSSDHHRCKWHKHLKNCGYFDYRKTRGTQFEPHAGIKMAQVLQSPLYICGIVIAHKPSRWGQTTIHGEINDINLSMTYMNACLGTFLEIELFEKQS